jgi:hypothetical protein
LLSVNFNSEKRSKIKQTTNDSYKFTKKLSRLSRWIKSRWDRCCHPDGILFSGAGEGARIALYSASGGGNAWRDVTSDVVLSFPPIGSRVSSPLSSTILQKFLRTDTITAKRRAQVSPFCHLLVLTWLLFSVDHSYSHSYAGYLSLIHRILVTQKSKAETNCIGSVYQSFSSDTWAAFHHTGLIGLHVHVQ